MTSQSAAILDGLDLESFRQLGILDSDVEESVDTALTNTSCIGSYNWSESEQYAKPVIVVPGAPRRWLNLKAPFEVASGPSAYMNENAFHLPNMPLLPLIAAVDASGSQVDWPALDFVTDRGNLRRLLQWVSGGFNSKPERIDLQLVGDHTVLMNRWDPKAICYTQSVNFGRGFESTTTAPAKEGYSSYYQILKYELGGLHMIVRCEADACLPAPSDEEQPSSVADTRAASVDASSPFPAPNCAPLHILQSSGSPVPASSLIELKVISSRKRLCAIESYSFPQLYLSLVSNLFVGIHTDSKITRIREYRHTLERIDVLKDRAESQFRKLVHILKVIQRMMVERGPRSKLSLTFKKSNAAAGIVVYVMKDDTNFLPEEVLARFSI